MAKRTNHGVANPSSALFIGNSFFYYNNGVNHHLNQMLLTENPKFKWRQVLAAISGAGLDWHDVESYFRPNALSSFSFDPDNNIVFNTFDRLFDLAIMMDGSDVSEAYKDVIDRFLGEDKPLRFTEAEKPGFFKRLFGGK